MYLYQLCGQISVCVKTSVGKAS